MIVFGNPIVKMEVGAWVVVVQEYYYRVLHFLIIQQHLSCECNEAYRSKEAIIFQGKVLQVLEKVDDLVFIEHQELEGVCEHLLHKLFAFGFLRMEAHRLELLADRGQSRNVVLYFVGETSVAVLCPHPLVVR